VLARLQRHAEAAAAAELADQLAPGERMARQAFRCASRGELASSSIDEALLRIPAREGSTGADPELVLMAACARVNLGQAGSVEAGRLVELVRPHLAVHARLRPEWALIGLRAAAQEGGVDSARKSAEFAAEASALGEAVDQSLARMLAGLARAAKVDS
jgi:hypothetical protein